MVCRLLFLVGLRLFLEGDQVFQMEVVWTHIQRYCRLDSDRPRSNDFDGRQDFAALDEDANSTGLKALDVTVILQDVLKIITVLDDVKQAGLFPVSKPCLAAVLKPRAVMLFPTMRTSDPYLYATRTLTG